jgi:hypothetical protein
MTHLRRVLFENEGDDTSKTTNTNDISKKCIQMYFQILSNARQMFNFLELGTDYFFERCPFKISLRTMLSGFTWVFSVPVEQEGDNN